MTDDPFARVRVGGVSAASPVDLLAVGIARREADGSGTRELALGLIRRFGQISELKHVALADLRGLGLDEREAIQVAALLELGRRTAGESGRTPEEIAGPADVARLLAHLRHEKREHFVAIYLDAKHRVLRWSTVHIGTLTMSVVGAREIFREAVREGAESVIVAHNHPSGDPTPSPEDVSATKALVAAGKLLDIPVLDHIVLGDRRHVSLFELGYVE